MPPNGDRTSQDGNVFAILDVRIANFVMRAVEALSVGETAACLGIPEETVRTRFFRARRLLQIAVEERVLGAETSVYAFHLQRCDRVVHAMLARIAAGAVR